MSLGDEVANSFIPDFDFLIGDVAAVMEPFAFLEAARDNFEFHGNLLPIGGLNKNIPQISEVNKEIQYYNPAGGAHSPGGKAFPPACLGGAVKRRSFSDLLADWQAGKRLQPGKTYVIKDIPEELIVRAWGSVPSAVSCEGITVTFQRTGFKVYRAILRT